MTTKEIAQAVGKDERSVQRWIAKILQRQNDDVDRQNDAVKSIRLKAGNKDPHHPADYTLEETIAIIEEGMGSDAAGIFRDNAAAQRPRLRPVTGAYLRELTAAYDKSIISKNDWRRLAGLDPMPEDNNKQIKFHLLEERTKGLEFYQRTAESAGLVNSDLDDIKDIYRRR
jgi:hypothetical protein